MLKTIWKKYLNYVCEKNADRIYMQKLFYLHDTNHFYPSNKPDK